jgi:ATP-dependent DNA helicase RecQ
MYSLTDAITSLRTHFGFDNFREGQRDVIEAVLAGKDVVVVMPTGSGKSLCYQLILDGATVVVSPLIALMKDQVDALRARGLPATFVNSSIPEAEQHARIESLRRGEHKLVYVAPERFRSSRFNAALQSIPISLFAIDEAHCISSWGHDFRPDYLRLRHVIRSFGKVPTLALTATATRTRAPPNVRQRLRSSKPAHRGRPHRKREAQDLAHQPTRRVARRLRHHLHVNTQSSRTRWPRAQASRASRHHLSRRHDRRDARPRAGRIHERAHADDRCDQRVRYGHRQA